MPGAVFGIPLKPTAGQGVVWSDALGGSFGPGSAGTSLEGFSTSSNTALGDNALDSLSTGTGNTGFGVDALTALTSGTSNVAFGDSALEAITSSSGNTVVGFQAYDTGSSGDLNTAVGYRALRSNTANGNTALGCRALNANTSGVRNIGIGLDAVASITTTSDCTGVGYNAMIFCTGTGSTALGSQAGYNHGTGANYNTSLGFKALYTVTTGTNNIGIGANAGIDLANNITNVLVIGNTSVGSDYAVNTAYLKSANAYGAAWQDPMTWVDRTYFKTPNSSPTDGNLQTASVTWYLDESGNNLKVRVKYTDGTTLKTGTLALV